MNTKNQQKNKIPDGWEEKRLVEVGKPLIGLTYSPNDVVKDFGTLVLRSSNIKSGKIDYSDQVRVSANISKKNFVKEDDILICARNGSRRLIGKNAYIHKKDAGNAFGAFMLVFRAENPKYIYQLFQSFLYKKEIERDLGPTINQVTTGNLSKFKFHFPPVSEQKRIVEVLEVWDGVIEKLGRKIELKKNIKKGLMQNLLTGKIRLSGFIGEWKTLEFNDFFNVLKKPKGIKKSEYLISGQIPIIDQSIGKFVSGYINKEEAHFDFTKTPVIVFGDHSRVIKFVNIKTAFGNDGIKLFSNKDILNIKFGYFLLKNFRIPETGYNRHFKYLENEVFEIPSKKEQTAIANILTTADNEIEALEKKKEIIEAQKKYLLNNLITGKIRTPDPVK